jgi:glycosyltransferase involved in cell wall biosynthesis
MAMLPGFRLSYQSVLAYISFDTVPAPKGAATHIEAFARALGASFGGVELATVARGAACVARMERWPGVFHTELPAVGVSLIDRVLCFRHYLSAWMGAHRFEAVQFRSPFEGMAVLKDAARHHIVFEVNGLPSVELKYRYPDMVDDRELMRKLLAQERACFDAADRIVTPSAVTREYLAVNRGVDAAKINVIPNGVDLEVFRPGAMVPSDSFRLLYFGTLSAWQGVELGIRALRQAPATLTILGSGSDRQRDALWGLAAKLGVGDRVAILPAVSQAELVDRLHRSDAVVALLASNDRNVEQGCCPLKILEAMAAGVPVIASDLPVVRELGPHMLLVKPGSVDETAQTILRLIADRELRLELSRRAREHVERNFTWERAGAALVRVYEELGIKRLTTACS